MCEFDNVLHPPHALKSRWTVSRQVSTNNMHPLRQKKCIRSLHCADLTLTFATSVHSEVRYNTVQSTLHLSGIFWKELQPLDPAGSVGFHVLSRSMLLVRPPTTANHNTRHHAQIQCSFLKFIIHSLLPFMPSFLCLFFTLCQTRHCVTQLIQ